MMQDEKKMTEAKIKTRKFRIIGWRKSKLLEDMTVPELMTMRNREKILEKIKTDYYKKKELTEVKKNDSRRI